MPKKITKKTNVRRASAGRAPKKSPRILVVSEPKRKMIGPMRAIANFWRKYFDFMGRSTRSEFWFGILFVILINWFIAWLVTRLMWPGIIASLVSAVVFVPMLTLFVRRFRDAKISVWLYIIPTLLIYVIPMVRGALWAKLIALNYVSSGMLIYSLFFIADLIFNIVVGCLPSKR